MQPMPGPPGRSPATGAVAIIAALRSERSVLERQAVGLRACIVYQSGPGESAARAAAARAVDDGATRLVAWGLAGGLTADAVPGLLVLPEAIVGTGVPPLAVDAGWRARVLAALEGIVDVIPGNVATLPAAVTTPAAKAHTAATLGAVAVDMESRAIGEVAGRAGLPFVAIRAIVDGADDRLPAGVESLIDARGNVRLLRAVMTALRAPVEATRLHALGRQSALAHRTLARAAIVLGKSEFGSVVASVGVPH
jgi:hypothetical protein